MDNPIFYTPTRGYPDQPAYIANLIETKLSNEYTNKDKNEQFNRYYNSHKGCCEHCAYNGHNDNCANCIDCKQDGEKYYNPQLPSVLQLMGFQKYPGSSKYDYYVLLPSTGNNPPIKYFVKTHRNEEVFDGDIIEILGKSYFVQKNKSPFEYIV
jgi:hypothetical protein